MATSAQGERGRPGGAVTTRPAAVTTGPGTGAAAAGAAGAVQRVPPTSWFLVSAVFHYLGPSLAVLLFARVEVLGVVWFRIVTAAVVFAAWRRPWRLLLRLSPAERWALAGLGALLASMNVVFYLAIDRLPLSTVGAIEFLGTVVLAAAGARTRRNAVALVVTVGGVAALTDVRLVAHPVGFVLAFANCAGFMAYVVLGHRIANRSPGGHRGDPPSRGAMDGVDQLGAAMIVAAVVVTPIGLRGAFPAFPHPLLVLAGMGVGLCSSVIPYVTDQLAMARLPRATFALMLALLPASATVIGLVVLGQVPTVLDLLGIGLVIAGVALHRPADAASRPLHAKAT
ncbi:MAG: EamA family transporter [Acidimicrobiales bacterium]